MTQTRLSAQRNWRSGWRHPLLGIIGVAAIAVACRAVPPSEAPSPTVGETPEPVTEAAPEVSPPADTTTDDPAAAAPNAVAPANPVSSQKQDCGQRATQSDINACAQANYAVSDEILNQVYQTLRSNLSASDKTMLTTAEQAWIAFRDAQCEFERSRFDGGSIAPLILSSCLEQITDQRIEELRAQTGSTQAYAAADTRLNQAYQELREAMDESVWPNFQAVQRDWLAYRDANCTYEAAATLFTEEQCLSRMTVSRTAQLEQQLEQWNL